MRFRKYWLRKSQLLPELRDLVSFEFARRFSGRACGHFSNSCASLRPAHEGNGLCQCLDRQSSDARAISSSLLRVVSRRRFHRLSPQSWALFPRLLDLQESGEGLQLLLLGLADGAFHVLRVGDHQVDQLLRGKAQPAIEGFGRAPGEERGRTLSEVNPPSLLELSIAEFPFYKLVSHEGKNPRSEKDWSRIAIPVDT